MSLSILIADDDHAICTVLSHAVRKRGWEPLVAHRGETLMEWVRGGQGDVIITDVRMPVGEPYQSGLDMSLDPKQFHSKSLNSPFDDWQVAGRAIRTIVGGETVFRSEY